MYFFRAAFQRGGQKEKPLAISEKRSFLFCRFRRMINRFLALLLVSKAVSTTTDRNSIKIPIMCVNPIFNKRPLVANLLVLSLPTHAASRSHPPPPPGRFFRLPGAPFAEHFSTLVANLPTSRGPAQPNVVRHNLEVLEKVGQLARLQCSPGRGKGRGNEADSWPIGANFSTKDTEICRQVRCKITLGCGCGRKQ